MAKHSNPCLTEGDVRSVQQAVDAIKARLGPVEGVERVPIAEADGRILAADLRAGCAVPPFTRSAMDGYAVRGEDLPATAPKAFVVADRVRAGAAAAPLAAGEAARIFTGAPMPAGADTVVMQEDVELAADGRITIPPGLEPGANVRLMGEDLAAGQLLLRGGRRLQPQDVAAAAATGAAELEVRRRVRAAVFSNGDELVEPGGARLPAQIFDSNRYMLIAMLRRLGCAVTDLGILPDDPARIGEVLQRAAGAHDLVLSSGGVSVGEADHVRACVEKLGSLTFWRLPIKPGRPVAMGELGGTPFIGLPGNPVASFVTFVLVARPAVLALAGAEPEAPPGTPVRAAFGHAKRPGRREFLPARLRRADDGALEAVMFPKVGSALLSSLIDAEGLVDLPEEADAVAPGQTVVFIPYAAMV
jgi:molybdopterin molybdotransferase